MSKTDEDAVFTVGEPLPELASVSAVGVRFEVAVTWRDGKSIIVDLAPDIFTFKAYAALRDDPDLFKTVHIVNEGAAIGWGSDDGIDMPVTAIERLAAEVMDAAGFKLWLQKCDLTRDAAAAQLGISRRLVGYFASGQRIPRHIAFACAYIEGLNDPAEAKPRRIRIFDGSDTAGSVTVFEPSDLSQEEAERSLAKMIAAQELKGLKNYSGRIRPLKRKLLIEAMRRDK